VTHEDGAENFYVLSFLLSVIGLVIQRWLRVLAAVIGRRWTGLWN
jgi:hypothetical protein